MVYVTAELPDGSRRDVTGEARFTSSDACVRASSGGALLAAGDGSARVTASFGGREVSVPVQVRRSAAPRLLSFRYDVLPVLSRSGCNQGSCHGNAEGKGGIRLSLKGEDPEHDYDVLALDGGGRRVNRADPSHSLLLLKATSTLPHGGGLRFSPRSEEFATVAAWIAQGARFEGSPAPRLVKLDVSPAESIAVAPARFQRLSVTGTFSDGSVRDLARRAVYVSSDPNVEVSPDGAVTVARNGDAAILVRYAEQLCTTRVTFIPARKEFVWDPPAPANAIDEINFRRLKQLRLRPSRVTTDAEFLRRAYLDAIGRLPSPDEVRSFAASGAADKRARLIDTLLQRPEFNDFWTLKWSDILRSEERSLDAKGIRAYQDWIRESLAQNKPLNHFARELLIATGSTYTNPPANYYRRSRTPIELAETTAQVFMGVRILCAKCHNHPFERWTQDDFYSLAAYFARVDRKIPNLTRRDRFDTHELNGEELISVAAEGEVKDPRTGRPVTPQLPPGASRVTDSSIISSATDRRTEFAAWLTAPGNPYLARALVNRVWYHLLGRGIIDPVDDLRESNPASSPELLDTLARDFAAHGFDLRYLVRTIMNSRTYQLSSEANATNGEDERFFSRGIAQRLPAEVLLDAASDATGTPEAFTNFPAGTRAVQLPPVGARNPFLRLFGQPARETVCECERSGESTLGQAFALISGGNLDRKLKQPDNRLGKLLAAGKSNAEIATECYLATVSREPTRTELDSAVKYVNGNPDRRAALEDLLWALMNSKEFLLRR